jgi:nicotinamidase-related amidase
MSGETLGQIEAVNTMLLICDIQEVFRYRIENFDNMVENCAYLIEVAKILNIPLIVTEQNPEALGNTINEIKNVLPENISIQKKESFSMVNEGLLKKISDKEIKSVIIIGIETHICILQTALELRKEGIDVHIILEAVSSQRISDKELAISRMVQSNIFITGFESIVFQLLKSSKHVNFKEIIKIIKKNSEGD